MTTKTELRHLLEMAARACGCSSGGHWSPHADDGMSARMRTALRMNVLWSDTAVHCLNSMGEAFESFADHNGDRDAALRLCALKVAAMIGEGME